MHRPKLRKRDTSVKNTKQGATHLPPMEILIAKPPIWDACDEAFELDGREIFCYGNIIYNPSGGRIPKCLMEHEKVHRGQQGDDPEVWWIMYIDDPAFRLNQELEAHKKEFRVFRLMNHCGKDRVAYLEMIAERLASPMYGNMITKEAAMQRIKQR